VPTHHPTNHLPARQSTKHSASHPLSLCAGTDREGRPFRWLARRQRKRVSHTHECPSPPPRLSWLGWLDARLHAQKLGWWVGLCFTIGSVLFVISGAAGEAKAVGDQKQPAGLESLSAALISWPNVIAANLLFFPGGLMQVSNCCALPCCALPCHAELCLVWAWPSVLAASPSLFFFTCLTCSCSKQ